MRLLHYGVVFCAAALGSQSPAGAAERDDIVITAGAKTFRLVEARGRYVALHFLLKTECPYCMRHVAEYARHWSEVAGVEHIYLKPDSAADIEKWKQKAARLGAKGVTIHRDADARLAQAFNIPGDYSLHGQAMHYPALIVIGPDGNELFRHIGKDNTDRLAFDHFARRIAELSRNKELGNYNVREGKPAIAGHDPVAYIVSSRAEPGSASIQSNYRGLTYQFTTPQNREKFAANPQRYIPAYGGWCATAMAEGRKVEIDPTNFTITNGRLFLFYKGWLGNALNDWNKNEAELTRKADAAWKKIAPTDARSATGAP